MAQLITRWLIIVLVGWTPALAAAPAQPHAMDRPELEARMDWLDLAWTWLGALFSGAAEDEAETKPKPPGDGSGTPGNGVTVKPGTGGCIDPLGNPVPCPDYP